MKSRLPAFSLIEISIVLIILGIITSLSLPILTASLQTAALKKTEQHREHLFFALAGYVLKHHRLPCPSQIETLGIAQKNCDKMCSGIVPFKDLGISAEIAKDGHGHWFTYAINPELAQQQLKAINDPVADITYCTVRHGPLILQTSENDSSPAIPDKKEDHIAVILVSHGPKGSGAPGQAKLANNRAEEENSNGDTTFILQVGKDFQHHVYWVSRNNLIAMYGKFPCQQQLLDTPTPKVINEKLW